MARFASREGQWFAVPLDDGRYGLGLVARDSGTGVLLAYFFGPARDAPAALAATAGLGAADAVLVGKVGHLGLRGGTWPVVGTAPTWDRRAWPVPPFVRSEELTGRTLEIVYDDDHPTRVLHERVLPPGTAPTGPRDGLMGAGYAQAQLSRLLTPGSPGR